MKTDILGNIPKIGDVIIFNPPGYKGVIWGKICSLGKTGNPQIDDFGGDDYITQNTIYDKTWGINREIEQKGFYPIRTNFVIK